MKKIVLLFQADVESLRPPEYTPVFLTRLTNSWCIHNRKQLLNIVYQKLIEQSLIPLLHNININVSIYGYAICIYRMCSKLCMNCKMSYTCRSIKAIYLCNGTLYSRSMCIIFFSWYPNS